MEDIDERKTQKKGEYIVRLILRQIKDRVLDTIKIDINKIDTTKKLKYFIIDKYENSNLCPCKLVISEEYEDGFFCSEANDNLNAKLKDYFPNGKIYIIIHLNKDKKICDCGFTKLKQLSKREIYEMYNEKIKKLKILNDRQISELKQKIEDYEETIKVIFDNNKTPRGEKCIKLESIDYFKHKTFEDFYDVIIDIKSIKDINKGWNIKMNKNGEMRFNEYKNKKALVIGIIGNSNKGKSFLLSKISKIDLPSGTSIRTEGLSIKYPDLEKYKNRNIILLDTAGLETPLSLDKEIKFNEENQNDLNELIKEKAREKLITELFLQNFILYNSDILITVVGILTYSEQKLLNRIKAGCLRNKQNKKLYIIHNLMTYTTINEVEEYINNCLLKSATFDLKKRYEISTKKTKGKNVPYFCENNGGVDVFHLIFANQGSEAGNFYNDFTLNFFEQSYQTVTDINSFDVIQKLKESLIDLSSELLDKNEKNENDSFFIENDFYNDEYILRKKIFKLNHNKDIVLRRCYIDEMGLSYLRNNGFNPLYNYYRKNDKLIIRIEAPGNITVKTDFKYSQNFTIIKISGNKRKDIEPLDIRDNWFNTREFGDFNIEIPLLVNLNNKLPIINKKEGIVFIEYEIRENVDLKKTYYFRVNEEEEV